MYISETYDLSGGAAILNTVKIIKNPIFIQIITNGGTVNGTIRFETSADEVTWNELIDSNGDVVEFVLTEAGVVGNNYEGFAAERQYLRPKVTVGTAGSVVLKIT